MVLCEAQHITVQYGDICVLQHMNCAIDEGDFVVVAGTTGSGKSTFLRLWQHDIAPNAHVTGTRTFQQRPLEDAPKHVISYVSQNPHEQLVMEKVWQELAFPLENMQLPQHDMEQRIAEVLQYLGITHLFDANVTALSGGQKQLVHLAVALIQRPTLLLLDEPTAQLDPLAATHFIELLTRIHRELGLTILLVEHRLEEVLPHCTKLLVIDEGRITHYDSARAVIAQLQHHPLLPACGAAAYVSTQLQWPLAVTVQEARQSFPRLRDAYAPPHVALGSVVLEATDLYVRYARRSADILIGASVTLHEKQLLAIVGGNGTGKSTLLQTLAAIQKAYKGRVKTTPHTRVAYLTQNPLALFTKLTVEEELRLGHATAAPHFETRLQDIIELLQLKPLLQQSPFALSGGQQQLVAFAKIYCIGADLLLLDEPTKGLDPVAKMHLGQALIRLQQQQTTILFVTHDVDFAASYASHCAMLFQGKVTPPASAHTFFQQNRFYTTSARRISVGKVDGVISADELRTMYEQQGGLIHA